MTHASQLGRLSGGYFGHGGGRPSASSARTPVLDPATPRRTGTGDEDGGDKETTL